MDVFDSLTTRLILSGCYCINNTAIQLSVVSFKISTTQLSLSL